MEGANVTKGEFIDKVADRSGLSKKDATAAVDAVLQTIQGTLKSGGDITLTGFGKFHVQQRAARTGVNPRNPGQKVQIPASKVPKFTAGSALKSAVKG
jgi:DNA-binding protein HU-beta